MLEPVVMVALHLTVMAQGQDREPVLAGILETEGMVRTGKDLLAMQDLVAVAALALEAGHILEQEVQVAAAVLGF